MKKLFLAITFFSCGIFFAQRPNVIPAPSGFVQGKESFKINEKTGIKYKDSFSKEAEVFMLMAKNIYGISLKRVTEGAENLIEIDNESPIKIDQVGVDNYQINIGTSKITINSNDDKGAFYGLMTLVQMLNNKKNEIQNCTINDGAKYRWRGMHLDVSRHFFPKDFIKKYIDLLAIHKMNAFHWHLTDDQGWRIEIKKYPKLTKVGAWRKGSMVGPYNKQRFDTITYGGFYTQDDIKEIVAYASARHINVVPEIEMPGHSLAALAAYPQFACKDSVWTVAKGWGVFEDVYCSKDETFKFLEDVLSEVCVLFPSPYIHIGGDECPKTRWKACAKCQARMKNENLKDENELQSYFIKRVEKFVNSKGKQIIGWDEILDGGLAPQATVMSWRGTEGGETAAKQNHDVVMTPGSHCYFDHYQAMPEFEPNAIGGYTTVKKVYSYDPTPEFLAADKQKYILGAQGNVWTEYINAPKDVEYMALPRMCALAEVLWNKKSDLNWDDFTKRLASHFTLLDKMKCNYSKSIYDVQYQTKQKDAMDGYDVVLSSDVKGTIRYTTDGKDPDNKSTEYKDVFSFDASTTVKAGLFIDGKLAGRILKKDFIKNMASGRKVDFNRKPSEKFSKGGSFTLVNGVLESASLRKDNCLGWMNDDANFTVDLGSAQNVKKVTLYCMQEGIDFIVLPKSVTVYYSSDDGKFEMAGKTKFSYSGEDYVKVEVTFEGFNARYIKLRADNPGKVTAGKVSHNKDFWLLLDEVVIE